MQKLEFLKQHFGFSQFRGVQENVLEFLDRGESALVLMATGQGKSLCYQFPALENQQQKNSKLVLVISPLIALMKDQVDKARKLGLRAFAINSSFSRSEKDQILSLVESGEVSLLFVTPERFASTQFREVIAKRNVGLLCVDEAHCISQWGHDFRLDYSGLGEIRQFLKDPTTLALTATATPEVQKDILQQLRIPTAKVLSHSIQRPNIAISVEDVYGLEGKLEKLREHLNAGPTIFYFSKILTLHKISQELKIPHLIYHGEMSARERNTTQKKFMEGSQDLILATPAFGLGIDKPDIRLIVHAEIPGSLEAYFQEIGRSGRDGKPSEAKFLWDAEDVDIQMDFIKWSVPDHNFLKVVFQAILNGVSSESLQEKISGKRFDPRIPTSLKLLEHGGFISGDESRWQMEREPSQEEFAKLGAEAHRKNQLTKLLDLVRWAEADSGCRMNSIYQYFGSDFGPCGICDLCKQE